MDTKETETIHKCVLGDTKCKSSGKDLGKWKEGQDDRIERSSCGEMKAVEERWQKERRVKENKQKGEPIGEGEG